MSSIIKGERIRKQTIINLSERLNIASIEYNSSEPLVNHVSDTKLESEEEQVETTYLKTEALLQEAHLQAEEILKSAREEAYAIREIAQVEKTNVLSATMGQQAELLEQANEKARQVIEAAYAEKEQIISNTEGELAQTLSSLLHYLVGEEIYHNTQWLLCIVKRMLSNTGFKRDIKVYVSPNVYNRLTQQDKENIAHMRDKVTLQISDTMGDTACRVEAQEGAIEYDVSQGLDKVISDIKILENLKQEQL